LAVSISSIVCATDSTELTPQAIATLEKQAQWLRSYHQYAFLIEGHADERGTREYNIALGARRAQAVRDYLASRGVDSLHSATQVLFWIGVVPLRARTDQ
jgi:peptidoglycan-associated lipoprotein